MSLPSRGARIEILMILLPSKPNGVAPLAGSEDRNDANLGAYAEAIASLPSRGARIEIPVGKGLGKGKWSLPSRGARIEMIPEYHKDGAIQSLPSRGARIEMKLTRKDKRPGPSRSPRGERG